ncbi:hypothetical protein C8R45DRAFT_1127725, partial [Mycena sanguinolenta]
VREQCAEPPRHCWRRSIRRHVASLGPRSDPPRTNAGPLRNTVMPLDSEHPTLHGRPLHRTMHFPASTRDVSSHPLLAVTSSAVVLPCSPSSTTFTAQMSLPACEPGQGESAPADWQCTRARNPAILIRYPWILRVHPQCPLNRARRRVRQVQCHRCISPAGHSRVARAATTHTPTQTHASQHALCREETKHQRLSTSHQDDGAEPLR